MSAAVAVLLYMTDFDVTCSDSIEQAVQFETLNHPCCSSSQVEAKLIDKLDSLMSEGKGDETYRELFNSM